MTNAGCLQAMNNVCRIISEELHANCRIIIIIVAEQMQSICRDIIMLTGHLQDTYRAFAGRMQGNCGLFHMTFTECLHM